MQNETRQIKYKKLVWHDIINPNEEIINSLAKKYRFHHLAVEDCLSRVERPKIDEYTNHLLIILHFPVYNESTLIVRETELKIFIGQNFFITLHDGSLKFLDKVYAECQNFHDKKEYLGKGTGYFLYEIVFGLLKNCFPILDKLRAHMRELEKDIFENERIKDLLHDLMIVKKNIITLRRTISPQRAVIASLEHKNQKFLPENLELYFDDVVDHVEKIWSALEGLKETIEALESTNESVITHRTNDVMRIFTTVTVLLMPPTLIASFFGMNTHLPFAKEELTFWIIVIVMIIIPGAMLGYFKHKEWL